MCMRMMSAGRSPSDRPPAEEAVRWRLSSGTEVRGTEAPGKVASQVLKLCASPGGPSRRWPAASPLSPAWLPSRPVTGDRPGGREAVVPDALMGCSPGGREAVAPSAVMGCSPGGREAVAPDAVMGCSPGGREAVAPDAVMGFNWGFPAELPAAGNMARMSATGEGAKRLWTDPRGKAGDAATAGSMEAEGQRGKAGEVVTAAGAVNAGVTGAG